MFWDSFNSAIHSNPNVSNVNKFNYLPSLLEGSASRPIKGLTLTSANYDNAHYSILQERYGKTQQTIAAHMEQYQHAILVAPVNYDMSWKHGNSYSYVKNPKQNPLSNCEVKFCLSLEYRRIVGHD